MKNLLELAIEHSEDAKRFLLQYEQENPKTVYTKLDDYYGKCIPGGKEVYTRDIPLTRETFFVFMKLQGVTHFISFLNKLTAEEFHQVFNVFTPEDRLLLKQLISSERLHTFIELFNL